MALDPDDAYRAGRLLHWGLQPRQRPAQEPEYRELIDRYLDRGEFRELVKALAAGLGLAVLDAGDHGIALGPTGDSAFALRPAEFRPATSTAEDRLIDGLVQLAIAATVFPTSRELEDEATRARPPVTVDEIEDNLRRLCKRIEQDRQHAPDPIAAEEAGFYEAWRVYQSRLAAVETSDNRQSRRATRRSIQYALDRGKEPSMNCSDSTITRSSSISCSSWRSTHPWASAWAATSPRSGANWRSAAMN